MSVMPSAAPHGLRLAALIILSLGLVTGCGTKGESSRAATNDDTEGQRLEAAALDPALAAAGVTAADLAGAHDPPVDRFHPAGNHVKPALGGRVIQHIASEPPNLNFSIENSAVIRWIYFDIHEGLLEFNPSTYEYDHRLAIGHDEEDTIVLEGGRGDDNGNIVFGKVTEDGDHYVVTSGSAANPMEERRIPKADVERLERGTVFTFHLRNDVRWHDGEVFDADDVIFSYDIFKNPHVDCDEKRYQFDQIPHGEKLDAHTVRFFYDEQYFGALATFNLGFCIMPSHLYNLSDPTNPDHDPSASAERRGEYINDNPHNVDWVGLGPYKLTKWERGRFLEAERFDGYWEKDPAATGYMDVLRWTHIDDDNLAFQALLNGEVDIFTRVKSEDFMGQATSQEAFTKNFYKAFTYVGSVGYTTWNTQRDKLSDVRVRQALCHATNGEEWIKTNYQGLALPATGPMFRFGPGYDAEVKPLAFDLTRAEELLAEAGWYDRDGNGIVDNDGEDLVVELLMPSGNKASEGRLQKMQEEWEKIGVKADIQPYEWATFLERILDRDYDAANLAWTLGDVESDPFGAWHSSEADRKRTGNMSGVRDAVLDSLIENGRRELNPEKRYEYWHAFHARLYELQPFLFHETVPRKLAFAKKLRGVKLYKFTPGFRLRDIYYEEGTPGTRPLEPAS